MSINSKILNTTYFSNLEKWSAYSFKLDKFNSQYPLVPLSKILVRTKEPISLDDGTLYKRVTVRLYGQGVLLRDKALGKEIGTKRQFIAHKGQLIISRIDARNGAFGIVPRELEGAIVTNDFWLFDVKDAMPEYLMLVLSSKKFQEFWQMQSSGTTNRQRVNESDFLSSRIALPTIKEQNAIIKNHSESITTIRELENQINEKNKEIDSFILTTLGVSVNQNEFLKGGTINRLSFKSIFRWDAWSQNYSFCLTKYPFTEFSRIVTAAPLYGANEKAINEKSDIRYIRITDINEDGTLNDEFVSAKSVDKKYLLKNNDFLIARSGNTVGKTFLYKSEFGKCIFAGYLIKYKLNTELIIPEYLLYYTKSSVFKAWIQNNQRIFGQPNINGQEYLNADIIVPEIEVQKDIVRKVNELRTQIQETKQQIAHISNENKKRFEEAVFGE